MKAKHLGVIFFCAHLAFCASSQHKVQKAREKDPKYQYNLGVFYLNQNNLDEAIKYLVKSLTLDTRNHLAWNALGLAHSLKGNFDESVKSFLKCLEVNPQFTEAHNNLGTLYQEMNRLNEAEAEFQKALNDPVYPSRELPAYNLARLFFLQDKIDLAYENAQKAAQLQPRLAMAHNLKGLILEKRDNLPEAIASYELAVKIVPDDVLFGYNLAVAYYKNGEWVKAKDVFLRISPKAVDPEMKGKISEYLKALAEKGAAAA